MSNPEAVNGGENRGTIPILLFFLLTFVISWGWAFLIFFIPDIYYLQSYESVVGVLATLFVGVQTFGPSISALLLTGFYEGKQGLKQYAESLIKFKVKYYWYLLVFLLPVFAYSMPIVANLAMGNPPNHDYFNTSLWGITLATVLSNIFFAALAEEPGWRGYALPKLNRHFRPIVSAVIIGVIWAFWHLLFYVFGSRDWIHFPQFVFTVTVISCIYTWIYMKTKSIPLMVIFHVMHNLTNTVFITYHNPLWGGIIYFGVLIVILLCDHQTLLKKPNLHP
jgi:membrane protease YdiL (CAAX protease family)